MNFAYLVMLNLLMMMILPSRLPSRRPAGWSRLLALGICLSLGHEGTDGFNTIDEEHAFLVVFPDEDADLVGVAAGGVVVGMVGEILEQEAESGGHAVAFELPQMDLVEDGGGQDRQGGAGAG